MTMDRWRSETVHDQAVNWLWTRISVTPLPSFILLGVPKHLGYPVRAIDFLLLLVSHGGAGDVQGMVGVDHGHRLTLSEAQLAEDVVLLLGVQWLICVPGFIASLWS